LIRQASDWAEQRQLDARHNLRQKAAAEVSLAIEKLASSVGYRQVENFHVYVSVVCIYVHFCVCE